MTLASLFQAMRCASSWLEYNDRPDAFLHNINLDWFSIEGSASASIVLCCCIWGRLVRRKEAIQVVLKSGHSLVFVSPHGRLTN